jgi:hypothetical protein
MKYQVVEKDDFGTDWHQVRYDAYAMQKFDEEADAVAAAIRYLTDVNCNNSLTAGEKKSGAEAFMLVKLAKDESGKEVMTASTDEVTDCLMGVLDGKDWYMTDRHGKSVAERSYYELEGKTQVTVRPVPGT